MKRRHNTIIVWFSRFACYMSFPLRGDSATAQNMMDRSAHMTRSNSKQLSVWTTYFIVRLFRWSTTKRTRGIPLQVCTMHLFSEDVKREIVANLRPVCWRRKKKPSAQMNLLMVSTKRFYVHVFLYLVVGVSNC